MANTSSAKKAIRVSERRRQRNARVRAAYKAARKVVTDAVAKGDAKAAKAGLDKAYSEIDTAAKKGVLHKNTASRYKSRMSAGIKAIDSSK